ncbi:hypothetical protein ACFL6Y_06505 [Elusimicrobiota bacterium]
MIGLKQKLHTGFFHNESVCGKDILASHIGKTLKRARKLKTILAAQDTSYFSYTKHKKTTGLGVICKKPGTNVKTLTSLGVMMHTSFAVTVEGLPLGILDQKVFVRQALPEKFERKKKKSHNINVAIEDKESMGTGTCSPILGIAQKVVRAYLPEISNIADLLICDTAGSGGAYFINVFLAGHFFMAQ